MKGRDKGLKRASYSTEFKVQIVKEAIETGNKSLVARKHVLSVGLVHRWVVEYEAGRLGSMVERTTNQSVRFS